MPRPKKSKCPACGYGICSVCHRHRAPVGMLPDVVKGIVELRHGNKVEFPLCKCEAQK